MKKVINSKLAPQAIGPYSQAIDTGECVFVSGCLGLDPVSGILPDGIEAQSIQALNNLKNIVETAGLEMKDIVKTTVFMADLKDFNVFNEIYARYFDGEYPARSCVQVAGLPKGGLVEIEAIVKRSK